MAFGGHQVLLFAPEGSVGLLAPNSPGISGNLGGKKKRKEIKGHLIKKKINVSAGLIPSRSSDIHNTSFVQTYLFSNHLGGN